MENEKESENIEFLKKIGYHYKLTGYFNKPSRYSVGEDKYNKLTIKI